VPKEENIADLRNDAHRLIDAGEFEKAKNILEQIVKSSPKDVSVLMLLANVYDKKGDLNTAERILRKAYELERQNDKLRFQLALVYKKIGGVCRRWKAKRLFKVCSDSSDYSIRSAAKYHIKELRIGMPFIQLENQTSDEVERMDTSDSPNQRLTKCPICGKEVEEWIRECPNCLRLPEHVRRYSSRIKTMTYSKLVPELVRLGRKQIPDSASASFYLRIAYKPARMIGEQLNHLGGLNLMKSAHGEVTNVLGPIAARELDMAWNSIGQWLG
jgi:tetratricopeptide (TPR) repeat protein